MNNINILYEDNHLLVVLKPVNVLSQSDNTKDLDLQTMLKNYIKVLVLVNTILKYVYLSNL